MSHLHLPDGVLPLWLWAGGLLLALALLIRASRRARDASPQRIAWQGSLGALMLAAMAVPLGPIEYHLTLAGPVGVLLGGAGAFQVAVIVSAILAFIGHGGFTAIGLNALLVGAAATVARLLYGPLLQRLGPATALAIATALGQAVAGAGWLAIVTAALRAPAGRAAAGADPHLVPVIGVGVPLLLVGVVVEALVAFGLARFLVRVRPELIGVAVPAAPAAAKAPVSDAPTRPGAAA